MILHGAAISPAVRKIILALSYKGLSYDLQPLNPYVEQEIAQKRHPMGKVPVLEHDGNTIMDSTVIAHYLDDICPVPPLYPGNAIERAKIRWIEEYVDTRVTALIGGVLFYQKILRGKMLEKEVDHEVIKQCLQHHLPPVLVYLEENLPENGFITEHFSMAELSLWSIFRTGWMTGLRLNQYPKLNAYISAIAEEPWVANLVSKEDHELGAFYCEPLLDEQP